MATAIETIVQAYVATVTSQQQSNEPQDVVVDTSSSSLISSSSNVNNDNNLQQPTLQPYSYLSFFRRAWDKVESIFVQRDTNLPAHYNHYEREENEDDDTDEFVHPNPYQQPFNCAAMFRPPVYKRRLSQHSQELITAADYSPRSSSEWPTRQTYEDWQRNQGELYVEEADAKDLIAGWAMGEGRPWFD